LVGVLQCDYPLNSPQGCYFGSWSHFYKGHFSSDLQVEGFLDAGNIGTGKVYLSNPQKIPKSSAPAGYLTLNGNEIVFVNSFN